MKSDFRDALIRTISSNHAFLGGLDDSAYPCYISTQIADSIIDAFGIEECSVSNVFPLEIVERDGFMKIKNDALKRALGNFIAENVLSSSLSYSEKDVRGMKAERHVMSAVVIRTMPWRAEEMSGEVVMVWNDKRGC